MYEIRVHHYPPPPTTSQQVCEGGTSGGKTNNKAGAGGRQTNPRLTELEKHFPNQSRADITSSLYRIRPFLSIKKTHIGRALFQPGISSEKLGTF
jgi:hypothetical protein